MPVRLLPAAARTAMPWKNGGGITTDVFVWPEGSGLDGFLARVSIAEVASDGPFSIFAGIDRSTAILAGSGFDLTFPDGIAHRLTASADPLVYSGDRHAHSRLIAGATTDLNAMSRRGRATHRMEKLHVFPGDSFTPGSLTVLIVTAGTLVLEAPGASHRLGPLDALVAEATAPMTIAGTQPAMAYRIDFTIIPASRLQS